MERSRFGTRQTVLGAVARSPSTAPRIALQALPGLAWRDLVDVAVAAELAPAVRQKAEALLLEGLNAMRLGDLITLSRIGPRRVASRLLIFADARVREAGLHNPRLRDGDLCAILELREAPLQFAAEILQVHRWATSYQVRRAIVRSPATPHPISLALIAEMNPSDLRESGPLGRRAAPDRGGGAKDPGLSDPWPGLGSLREGCLLASFRWP